MSAEGPLCARRPLDSGRRVNTESCAPLSRSSLSRGANCEPRRSRLQPSGYISLQTALPFLLWEKGLSFAKGSELLLRKRLSPHCSGQRELLGKSAATNTKGRPANKPSSGSHSSSHFVEEETEASPLSNLQTRFKGPRLRGPENPESPVQELSSHPRSRLARRAGVSKEEQHTAVPEARPLRVKPGPSAAGKLSHPGPAFCKALAPEPAQLLLPPGPSQVPQKQ